MVAPISIGLQRAERLGPARPVRTGGSEGITFQAARRAVGSGSRERDSARLIPRFLAVSGLVGYVCLMVGMTSELFGIHIGLLLSIPGIFFEVGLPVWLFSKGFQPVAYSSHAAGVLAPSVLPAPASP